jgi:hypothetical protein
MAPKLPHAAMLGGGKTGVNAGARISPPWRFPATGHRPWSVSQPLLQEAACAAASRRRAIPTCWG